ncbi:MAG: DUF3794 domain-containing protein [Clostridia bacterium]|nr:DUF3794 domain-containing protein [Clostridia bacterium]
MSIKPQYETYRYTGEITRLQSQSIVECRLPGSEIGTILAVQANAVPVECTCADGEVRYGGKLLLCIVYEDIERRICRAERGAEFFHKADGALVSPACFAKTAFSIENVSHRREGSGLYISVIVGADVNVYGGKQIEYLVGGEGLVVQKQPIVLSKTICVSGETEAEDEFDTDYVGDILLHGENAVVTSCRVGAGQLELEGEIDLNVCVLKSDETLCSYERVLPFTMQIPCEEAFGRVSASARVCVKSTTLTASVDEEKGKSKILFAYCLSADCFISGREELEAVSDAFSPEVEIELSEKNDGGRYLTNQTRRVERVSGVAALSPAPEGEYALEAAVLPKAEAVIRKGERGYEAEGVVGAEVLLRGADGSRRACSLSLPFAFPIDAEGEETEADCLVCGLNLRRKKDGETEAEATVKMCLRSYNRAEWAYVGEAVEGEKREESDAAVSVYVPRAGEDLWQVAKRLSRDPEELKKSNPELEFPVREGERIFVYRQIK